MKTTILFFSLLLFGSAVVLSRAGQIEFAPGFGDDNAAAAEPRTPVPHASGPNAFTDFARRVETAVERRDLAGIRDLYQTNVVTSDDIKRELTRWQPVLAQAAGAKVSVYFKELGKLPPTASQVWGNCARRLTTHKVTHLAGLLNGSPVVALVLPLIEVDGRLWIVPSDKLLPGASVMPANAANGNQPGRSGTNGISGMAGSRH
ncbi:MAG TPA: hypothetical protein VKS19_02030 [Verrucomicrobiae bacterium]|nr:hypothetical protein [Verrucomicrobiae bacterium]